MAEYSRVVASIISGPLAGVAVLVVASTISLTREAIESDVWILLAFAIALPFLLTSFIFSLLRVPGWSTLIAMWLGLGCELISVRWIIARVSFVAGAIFAVAVSVCCAWVATSVRSEMQRLKIEEDAVLARRGVEMDNGDS